jgi:hypothetical protein
MLQQERLWVIRFTEIEFQIEHSNGLVFDVFEASSRFAGKEAEAPTGLSRIDRMAPRSAVE